MFRKMLKSTVALGFALALVAAFQSPAMGQNAKSGAYSGQFGFYAVGNAFTIGENHLFWEGEFTGTFFNDKGSGIFHRASVKCPGVNDVINGVGHAHGYCIVTDSEGDQAVLSWSSSQCAQKCPGDFQWESGTGKYAGISGKNKFDATFVTQTEGYGIWTGNYKLP